MYTKRIWRWICLNKYVNTENLKYISFYIKITVHRKEKDLNTGRIYIFCSKEMNFLHIVYLTLDFLKLGLAQKAHLPVASSCLSDIWVSYFIFRIWQMVSRNWRGNVGMFNHFIDSSSSSQSRLHMQNCCAT